MCAHILGWFWIVIGILFFIKPHFLKRRLQKKSYKKARRYLFLAALFLGAMCISLAVKIEGLGAVAVAMAGIVVIAKGFFLCKSTLAQKVVDWFSNKPLVLFRAIAAVYIAAGLFLLIR